MRKTNESALGRKVVQLSIEGEELETFLSISRASRSCGASVTNIISAIKKNQKDGSPRTAGGFRWKYAENEVD